MLALLAAGALTTTGFVILAPPASAVTLTASGCDMADYQVTVGTTVVLTYGGDCVLLAPYTVFRGSPTIAYQEVDGYALRWHQAVGRASADATCEEGWSRSWAQWTRGGAGGYTCERVIDWGTFEGYIESVSITVNTNTDLANGDSEQSYVFGCNDGSFYGYTIIRNCPVG